MFLSDYSFRKKDHSGHGNDQHGSDMQNTPDTDAECDIGRIRVKYRCETSVGTQIMKQTIIQGKNSQSRRKEYCLHGETLFSSSFDLPSGIIENSISHPDKFGQGHMPLSFILRFFRDTIYDPVHFLFRLCIVRLVQDGLLLLLSH